MTGFLTRGRTASADRCPDMQGRMAEIRRRAGSPAMRESTEPAGRGHPWPASLLSKIDYDRPTRAFGKPPNTDAACPSPCAVRRAPRLRRTTPMRTAETAVTAEAVARQVEGCHEPRPCFLPPPRRPAVNLRRWTIRLSSAPRHPFAAGERLGFSPSRSIAP